MFRNPSKVFLTTTSNPRWLIRYLKMDRRAINTSLILPQNIIKLPSIGPVSLIATLINILLATSPYSFPYALKQGGIILGLILFIFSTIMAFIAVEHIKEAVAVASAMEFNEIEESPIKSDPKDKEIESNPFFIKHKLEIFRLCRTHVNKYITILVMVILSLFMYGALIIKCVSSCESFTHGISFIVYGDLYKIDKVIPETYYFTVVGFAVVATFFGLGNIEGSKILQLFVMYFRFFLIYLMVVACIYSIAMFGVAENVPLFNLGKIRYMISNVLYATFLHHSVSGFVYPLRPQSETRKAFIVAFALQGVLAYIQSMFAVMAFGERENDCNHIPCRIKEIFNISLMSIPAIGPLVQFFPALALAAFPVLVITLRNNLMQIFGVANSSEMPSFKSRIIWTLGLTLPVYIVSLTRVSIKFVINITGGFGGLFLLLFLPSYLAFQARRKYRNELLPKYNQENFHMPLLKSDFWIYFSWGLGVVVLIVQVINIANDQHHYLGLLVVVNKKFF